MAADQVPKWERFGYHGRPAAIDGMGTVAAPFLAGIGIALAVLVISGEEHFGAAGVALFALVTATIALIACVECAFMARQYAVRPGELEEWRPDPREEKRIEKLEREQHLMRGKFNRWADRARLAYNVGIVAFGVGVATLLVPKGGLGHLEGWRLAVFVLACGGAAAELLAVIAAPARRWLAKRGT